MSQNDVERQGGMSDAYVTVRTCRCNIVMSDWADLDPSACREVC
jgi:hypothetical protein